MIEEQEQSIYNNEKNISMHIQGIYACLQCSPPSVRPPQHPSADSYTAETKCINHQNGTKAMAVNRIKEKHAKSF
jgi:hypothetical protein